MKQIFFLVFMLFSGFFLGARDAGGSNEIDEEELRSIGDTRVEFINYVGPHDSVDTFEAIKDIGVGLARGIRINQTSQFTLNGKYRVVHIVDPETRNGLDADIFILEPEAAVDHIDNLRIIIAGYLQSAYGYSEADARVIAEFATYYNAVYRGDIDVVNERYKTAVSDFMEPSIIGIDRHYSNWPGHTQLIIPVRYTFGAIPSPVVDVAAISEKEVIEEIRKKEDRGLKAREAIVEIIEKQAEEDRNALNLQVQQGDDSSSVQETESGKNSILTRKDNKDNKDLAEQEKIIEEQIDKAILIRDGIARDKNELLFPAEAEPEPETKQEPAWLLHVDSLSEGIPYGRVIKYNLPDGEELVISPVTSVRGRQIIKLSDSILAIAGREGEKTRVRPILLDQDNLELILEGRDDVFPGSLINTRGREIYLVTSKGNSWHLGRFNRELKRLAVSDIPVDPWTSISFVRNFVIVQGESGEIAILSSPDLQDIKD